jgi:transcription initiation factor TFIIIB Brf1 subunit/transcription initiation factor TFIIB
MISTNFVKYRRGIAGSNITGRDTTRNYRQLVFELELRIPVIDPMKCIAKVANRVHLNEMAKRQSISAMHSVRKAGLSDVKNPMGLMATVLCASCVNVGESTTQVDIACAAAVTEVTLRDRFKDLRNHLIGTMLQYFKLIKIGPSTLWLFFLAPHEIQAITTISWHFVWAQNAL